MSIKIFSNLLVYRLTDPAAFHSRYHELNELLAEKPARLPAKSELKAAGFTTPLGIDDEYVELIKPKTFTFAINFAERMLPAKVVRQRVSSEVTQIEKEEERKVYAREKNQIKDKVISEMLPHAFIDQRVIRAMVIGPYIVIDTTSAKRGEDVLCMLREVLGTLGVRPATVRTTPIEPFTRWFTGHEMPPKFMLTGDFKANNTNDESDLLNGKGTSPKAEGLSDLVAEFGRRVTVLGLGWQSNAEETVYFSVNEMIGIKGIKWPEVIMDMASRDAGEEAEHHNLLRATLLLLADEMANLITDLLDALGGEEVPDNNDWEDNTWWAAFKHVVGAELNSEDVIRRTLARADELRQQAEDEREANGGELYDEAVKFVRESGRASISAVQRKLKIGYNRAARMIQTMEERGTITEMNSSGSREVIRQRDNLNSNIANLLDDLPETDDEEDVI